jgi:hypothetical protein
MGRRNGKLAWAGQLPAGGRLVFNTQRLIDGPCCLTSIDLLPGFTAVDITGRKSNGNVSIVPNGPNSLTITNSGSDTVTFVEVTWRVKE